MKNKCQVPALYERNCFNTLNKQVTLDFDEWQRLSFVCNGLKIHLALSLYNIIIMGICFIFVTLEKLFNYSIEHYVDDKPELIRINYLIPIIISQTYCFKLDENMYRQYLIR